MAAAAPLPAPSPAAAPCPVHPDRASVGACARCKRLCCALCRNVDGFCTECVYQAVSLLPPSRPRARQLRLLLVLHLGLSALFALLAVGDVALQRPTSVDLDTGLEAWAPTDALRALATVPYLLLSAVALFLFLRWVHLVVSHLRVRALLQGVSPEGAVSSLLIPVVNLVRPVLVFRGIARAVQVTDAPVVTWWALCVLATAGTQLPLRLTAKVVGNFGSSAAAFLCFALLFGAGALTVRLIDAIETGMRRRM